MRHRHGQPAAPPTLQEIAQENLFALAPVGVVLCDADGTVCFSNPAMQRMLGYGQAEIRGLSLLELAHPDDVKPIRHMMRRLQAGEADELSGEQRYLCRNGRIIWSLTAIRAARGADKNVTYLVVTLRDISQCKRVDEALHRTATELTEAQRVAHIGNWSFDIAHDEVHWSDELYRIFDIDHGEFDGDYEAFISRVHPDDRVRVLEINRAAKAGVKNFELEYRIVTRSGATRIIREVGYARKDSAGRVTGLFGTAQDISERWYAQQKAQLWAESFLNADLGLAIGNPANNTFMAVNPAFARQHGYGPGELVGRPIMTILPADRIERVNVEIKELDARGHGVFESEHQRKDGTRFPVLLDITVLKSADDKPLTRVAYVLDITGRKQAETQLHALAARLQSVREEERTRIARNVHDDLGQLLTGLSLDVAWLEKYAARVGDVELRQKLGDKIAEIAGLTQMMLASVQEIASDLRPAALDHLGICAALRQEAERFTRRSRIACALDLPPVPLPLPPDTATVLFRIAQECLTNVMRHAGATRVGIRLTTSVNSVTLAVHDDGRGVTPEQLADPASLGLLGMRERAGQLGGLLHITGAPGRGTTVTATVPT